MDNSQGAAAMNGQMKSTKYQNYLNSLATMKEPVIPNVRFDMRGLIQYAKQKGVAIAQLSESEKAKFVHPL